MTEICARPKRAWLLLGAKAEVTMRSVMLAFMTFLPLVLMQPSTAPAAESAAKDDAALRGACEKLVADPFAGAGPREWATPFQQIDSFQAIPVCIEALKRFPRDNSLTLRTALAFVSRGAGATALMRKAADAGNASGKVLYGMAQITGQGRSQGRDCRRSDLARGRQSGLHAGHAAPRQLLL